MADLDTLGFDIYLASNSPRRHELLIQAGIKHTVIKLPQSPGEIDEPQLPDEPATDYVKRTTLEKVDKALEYIRSNQLPERPILCADTTVILNQKVVDKAHTEDDVRLGLAQLSGQWHEVHTHIALAYQGKCIERTSISRVKFKTLTTADIDMYVASGEGLGKAGAYAIQGLAGVFVTHMEGNYSGIMGLPLFETRDLLLSI